MRTPFVAKTDKAILYHVHQQEVVAVRQVILAIREKFAAVTAACLAMLNVVLEMSIVQLVLSAPLKKKSIAKEKNQVTIDLFPIELKHENSSSTFSSQQCLCLHHATHCCSLIILLLATSL